MAELESSKVYGDLTVSKELTVKDSIVIGDGDIADASDSCKLYVKNTGSYGATGVEFTSSGDYGASALKIRQIDSNYGAYGIVGEFDGGGYSTFASITSYNASTTTYATVFDFKASVGTSTQPAGSIRTKGYATQYNTSSDYRLKEDLEPIAEPINRLKELKPINFKWKTHDERVDGFIAHELQEVIPEAASGYKDEVDEDGNDVIQGIDQSKIVPLLTAALQEAIARIEALEQKVES
jgi:hypothetical protein